MSNMLLCTNRGMRGRAHPHSESFPQIVSPPDPIAVKLGTLYQLARRGIQHLSQVIRGWSDVIVVETSNSI